MSSFVIECEVELVGSSGIRLSGSREDSMNTHTCIAFMIQRHNTHVTQWQSACDLEAMEALPLAADQTLRER